MAHANHFERFLAIVDAGNFDFMVDAARRALIGEEIVLQAIDQRQRNLADIGIASVGRIVFHDGNDLVVRFAAICQTEATDGQCREKNVAVRNCLLSEDADIEGIAIPDDACSLGPCSKQGRDAVTAIRLRDQPVIDGTIV